jgi:predicted transcriptional regulator
MVAGDVAELVAEPCLHVLDALVPGWQDAAVDEGLADLAAGLAARVGVDELVVSGPS